MQNHSSIAYRPDIDGLRAIAVLSVVTYHAAPHLLPGGYVGVDVFFVISGFLISTIILRERAEGCFSLAAFYARRIRRLFPALIVVLLATLAIGWYFLLPHEFRALGKHIAAGAAYFINFTLKREAGYFDAAAGDKPLLHLWSLAVEEQFYIVWPLLLLLIRERRHLLIALLLITSASFASNLNAVGRNPASAFYLPQNRVWELSLGALLAFAALYANGAKAWLARRPISVAALSNVASCLGLALILGAAFGYDDRVIYPGAWAAVPTLGAVLMIGAGPGGLVNRWLLAHPALVFVGLISYALYLWHWPLLSFAHILGIGDDDRITGALVAISAGLAIATWALVERPLRRARPPALPFALTGVTTTLCLAGALSAYSLLGPRLDSFRHRQIGEAIADWHYPDGLARQYTDTGLKLNTASGNADTVLYFGDSNIEQYWPRIEHLLSATHAPPSVVFATHGGCPPIPNIREKTHADCDGFADAALAYAQRDDIKTVVIAASWLGYFNNSTYYLDGEGGGRLMVGSHAWNAAFTALADTMRDLVAHGKSVWLVLNIPSSPQLTPMLSLRRELNGATEFRPLALDRVAFERAWLPIKAKLIAAARASGAGVIDPMSWLCDASSCAGQTADGAPIYTDGAHLRASYVRDHATFMDATLGTDTASVR